MLLPKAVRFGEYKRREVGWRRHKSGRPSSCPQTSHKYNFSPNLTLSLFPLGPFHEFNINRKRTLLRRKWTSLRPNWTSVLKMDFTVVAVCCTSCAVAGEHGSVSFLPGKTTAPVACFLSLLKSALISSWPIKPDVGQWDYCQTRPLCIHFQNIRQQRMVR